MSTRTLFTSESVTEGHPDKMADQISDAVLDALLAQDPRSRVACETLITTGLIVVAGEVDPIDRSKGLIQVGASYASIMPTGFDVDRLARAVIGLAFVIAAYMAEAVRGGREDAHRGVDNFGSDAVTGVKGNAVGFQGRRDYGGRGAARNPRRGRRRIEFVAPASAGMIPPEGGTPNEGACDREVQSNFRVAFHALRSVKVGVMGSAGTWFLLWSSTVRRCAVSACAAAARPRRWHPDHIVRRCRRWSPRL